jgi:hypothetical protein
VGEWKYRTFLTQKMARKEGWRKENISNYNTNCKMDAMPATSTIKLNINA